MKFSTALLAALPAAMAAPAALNNPFKRWTTPPTDVQVLQYALTLEHLEATFYAQALDKFSAQDFEDAGFADWVRGRTSQIAEHEASHVKLLSAALGNMTTPACEYAFPYTDVKSFLVFACGLENIGVSAYAGANQYITDATYSTVAATILGVEARHQGFFYGSVLQKADWTGPYETPLGLDMVYTLAAQLITSCPSNAAALPVTASSPLTSGGSPIFNADAGAMVKLDYKTSSSSVAGPVKAVIYNGLGAEMLDYDNGMVTLPSNIQGYSYIILTNAGSVADVTTANTVAGPAVVQTAFDAYVSNPGFMNPYGA